MDGPLVTAEWLAAHRDEVVIADVRWYLDGRSGRDAYRRGHIPGAVFVDLDRDLAAEASREHGRHPLPEPEAFAEAMSALGIGDDTRVVAYDDAGGSAAARLWWMLDVTGRRAAILDGGIQAWTGALASGDEHLPPAHLTPRPWPAERLAGIDDVERLRGDPDAVVLDARARERYTGESEPVDPRPGHVPGARSAHWALSIDPETGRFRDPEELREHFAALGADDAEEVVAYCGSGINACHEVLALHVAGVRARLFPGSWSQWSNDPDRPAAEGAEP